MLQLRCPHTALLRSSAVVLQLARTHRLPLALQAAAQQVLQASQHSSKCLVTSSAWSKAVSTCRTEELNLCNLNNLILLQRQGGCSSAETQLWQQHASSCLSPLEARYTVSDPGGFPQQQQQQQHEQQHQQHQQQHQQWQKHILWHNPWRTQGLQQPRFYSTGSASSNDTTTTTYSSSSSSSSSSGGRPKSSKGTLPEQGPAHKTLRALLFVTSRDDAVAAFTAYHSKSWYQSRQQPALRKPFRESYLPFWVGSGAVGVEVRGAEVGQQQLVTRTDPRTGKPSTQWETVWSRVRLQLAWQRQLQPEEADMQLYASWKYFRRDVQALAPKELLKLARPITPDMLQSSPKSGQGARRVGPFTLEPVRARRLLMAAVESKERRRAEEEIGKLLGASQVRFVDMHCTWLGSTGAAAGGAAAAAAGKGGLDLMPVYVPAYVFSWWHGGTKVRTFVSGVNAEAAGVQVLDDTKIATLAAAATTSVGLLLGLPLPLLFWGGLAVPFVAAGLAARFWPLLRTLGLDYTERARHMPKFWGAAEHGDGHEADWDAAFVHSFDRHERQQQQQHEQRSSYWQAESPWGQGDPFESFQEMFKDPFSWFERMYSRQQQQQGADQQQYKAHRQQARYERSGSSSGFRSSRDPKGYYQTLGVGPGSSTGEVQAAFRGLALQHHPDRYSSAADKARATKRFQTITEAYQVLRDPKRRAQYDSGGMA